MSSCKDISRVMKQAQEHMFSDDFVRVSNLLTNSRAELREKMQVITSGKIKEIIEKLTQGNPLAKEDLDCIRLWLVGDAEGYTKMENNFQDWLDEFRRLTDVLGVYEDKELSGDELIKLQGVLEDATRVSIDIRNFLEKKERVKNFEEATKDTASLDRPILIEILKAKLSSSEL